MGVRGGEVLKDVVKIPSYCLQINKLDKCPLKGHFNFSMLKN